ncbi:MAG TPA: lysylphosphatidylglycerol synthase transmembrane domain-containing protein [Actinomycetota bacterium]|nr:lysylphosphatidylglycerol synthase transmembrane domain-containing protein [Actinomycetota bacterium]
MDDQVGAPDAGKPEEPRASHRFRRLVVRILLLLGVAFIVEYLVVPQIAGARKALNLVSHVNVALILLGVALEAASLTCYAQLTRACLPRGSGLRLREALEIDLTTLGLSHVLPGGSAAGAGTGYHLLTQQGINGSDAGFALATQGLGSAVVLNVILWIGLVVSIPLRGYNPIYLTAAVVGVIIIGGFSAGVLLLMRGEERAARAFRAVARRVPFLNEASMDRLVHRLADRIHALASDPRLLAVATVWAAGNWLLDMSCLWVFLLAFGHTESVVGLVVSYGLANVVAAIPITPGGLGVMEAVLTSSLVGFDAPRGVAILGVVGWRLVQFWLPIPVGGLSYLALRVEGGAKSRRLRQLAQQAAMEREPPRSWAERHGFEPTRKDR